MAQKKDDSNTNVSPQDLISTAATADNAPVAPVGDATGAGNTTVNTGADIDPNAEIVGQLLNLLENDPELANKIADVIESRYGGAGMTDQSNTGVPNVLSNLPGAPGMAATPPGAGPMAAPQGVSSDILSRLESLENAHANMALDKELADVQREYETLKEHFPILPEFDEKGVLQIALGRGGIPLKDALLIWAMSKMQEGEGTVADRITAAQMAKSKAKGLPAVEGKGGGIPSGELQPPGSLKEARGRAKELLQALFSQPAQ